jgi:Lon protease-like protein
MRDNIGIELDSLVIPTDALPLDIMEMRYPTVRRVDHIGKDVGGFLHTCLVILA